jgi:hypothetical protein
MNKRGGALVGSPLRKIAATSRRGRVCEEGSCSTVLSVYNASFHCWVHEPRTTTRRPAPR